MVKQGEIILTARLLFSQKLSLKILPSKSSSRVRSGGLKFGNFGEEKFLIPSSLFQKSSLNFSKIPSKVEL